MDTNTVIVILGVVVMIVGLLYLRPAKLHAECKAGNKEAKLDYDPVQPQIKDK